MTEVSDSSTEFGLIDRYFAADHAGAQPGIALGIGDDAAIIGPCDAGAVVATSKTLASGIDFERNADSSELGARLVRHCLASLRNRNAVPAFAMLALTAPRVDEQWLSDFSTGLTAELRTFELPLVGGDTTRGPLTINLTLYAWAQS